MGRVIRVAMPLRRVHGRSPGCTPPPDSGATVPGDESLRLAFGVDQVVDGDFVAFRQGTIMTVGFPTVKTGSTDRTFAFLIATCHFAHKLALFALSQLPSRYPEEIRPGLHAVLPEAVMGGIWGFEGDAEVEHGR